MARSLTKQAIALQIRGLNTKAANALRLPGELETAHNVYMDKTGELRKRNGSASLSTTDDRSSSIASGQRLSVLGKDLVMETGPKTFHRASAAMDKWTRIGYTPTYSATFDPITDRSDSQLNPEVIYNNGLIISAWETASSYVLYSIKDATTGVVVIHPAQVSGFGVASFGPRLVNCGTKTILLVYETLTGIRARTIDTTSTTPTVGSATTVIAASLVASKAAWDAADFSSTQAKVCARQPAASGVVMTTCLISSAGVVSATASTNVTNSGLSTEYAATWALNTSGDGSHYVVLASYLSGSTQYITRTKYDASLAYTSHSILYAPPSTEPMDCTRQPAAAWNGTTMFYIVPGRYDSYKSITESSYIYNYYPASGMFSYDGNIYVLLHGYVSGSTTTLNLTDNAQPHYLLYCVSGAMAGHYSIGTYMVGSAAALPPNRLCKPQNGTSSASWLFAALRRTRVGTRVTDWAGVTTVVDDRNAAICITLDFAPGGTLGPCADLGGALFMPGGQPKIFDGQAISPYQATTPDKVRHTGPTTGTYLFSYVATFEWVDANGNVHRSAPSVPSVLGSATATPSGAVTLNLAGGGTVAGTAVKYVMWRTKANGTEYQRLTSFAVSNTSTPVDPPVTFTDTVSDTTLGTQEFLYTTGGVIENMAPPPCKVACAHRGRMWVASCEYPTELWYSKEVETNSCLEFSGYMTTDAGTQSEGEITALASLDTRLIVFKRSAIYHISGDGPNNLGDGEFSSAEKLPGDIGTVHPRSVVTTPLGVMFQAGTTAIGGQGIYLIGRDMTVSYIGAAIKDFESMTITGATYVPYYSQVRFTTDSGTTLVYDVINSQWFDWSGQGAAVGSCLWNNTHAWLSSSGVVSYEYASQFGDSGTPISSLVKFAPISLSDLNGFARLYSVYLLGTGIQSHAMTTKLYFDYTATAGDVESMTMGAGPFTLPIKTKIQKCTAVQVEISDAPATLIDTFRLQGITLQVGAKGRLNVTPSSSGLTPT